MTNADRIRNKTDHQLAEWIYFIEVGCECCVFDYRNCKGEAAKCYKGIMEWLEKEDGAE